LRYFGIVKLGLIIICQCQFPANKRSMSVNNGQAGVVTRFFMIKLGISKE